VTLTGVAFLDHTADVGIDVEAGSLAELLHRAALGMLALLWGEEEGVELPAATEVPASKGAEAEKLASLPVDVRGDGPVDLLAAWLREILFLHEVERLDYVRAELDVVEHHRVAGTIRARRGGHAAREIKGVTYHDLEAAERPGGGWHARVIFDV
jgi:SHS2 domain-containing protein